MDTDALAAARRESCPLPAGKQADFVRGVDLDFRTKDGYTRTKEPAVFVKSPSNQAKEKRKSLLEQPGIHRSVSAPRAHFPRRNTTVDVLTPHHEAPTNSGGSDDEHSPKALGGDDGSHDEEEPQSKECGTSFTTCGEIADVSCAEFRRGSNRSFRRGSTESTMLQPSDKMSSSDSEDSDDDSDDSDEEDSDEEEDEIEWNSEASLQRGVQKRASEQMRMLQLKSVTTRQKLRYSDPNCDAVTRMFQRRQVGSEAAKFTEVYANTLNIMQEHMTLEPPARRRHSVEVSDLAAYHVPTPNPEEGMATSSMPVMQDSSHGD